MATETPAMIEKVAQRAALGFAGGERGRVRELRRVAQEKLKAKSPQSAVEPALEVALLTNELKDVERLATVLTLLKQWKEAGSLWRSIGQSDSTSLKSHKLAARALSRGGDWEMAKQAWLRILAAEPDNEKAKTALEQVERNIKARKARMEMRAVTKKRPTPKQDA